MPLDSVCHGDIEILRSLYSNWLCIESNANEYTISSLWLIEIPDFTSPKNVKILRAWDGDLNSLNRIKLIRLHDPKYLAAIGASAAALAKANEESSAMQE